MPVSEITRERFDQLNTPNRCEEFWSRECERAWFACESNKSLGVLLQNPLDQRWSYMLCVQIDHSGYRRVGLGADIPNEQIARQAIVDAMEGYRSGNC